MRKKIEPLLMNGQEFSELNTSQLVLIDKHCTQYEQALRKKQAIPLEKMLDSVSADIQRPLFKELLHQNIAHRRQRGESINRDEYTLRFPNFVDLIDEVWMSVFTFKEIPADTNNTDKPSLNISDGLTISGYKIKNRLARGGMGVVYLAQDMKLNREVAIKMLSSDNMSLEQTERFQMEARAISALHHPNIIQIYSVGEHHGQPYLVLEYADAGTLKERLEKTSFQRAQVLETMLVLVKTIVFVHEKGFLHRDLKPSNILFDHEGKIKIGDFGLAKDITATTELTHTQNMMGTPAYMAPEQVDKCFGNISELGDIYSLGVLLHSLLTGVTPYDGLSAPELLKELTSEKDVPKTYLLEHNIDKALMTVCLRCLEKQPRHRYQSATLLFDDLKRLQSGQAVSRQTPYKKYIDRYLAPVIFAVVLLTGVGYLLERTTQTTVETNERTHLLGSKVIGQLDPAVLASVNADYQGDDNFKLVNLLPVAASETTDFELKSPQGLALYQNRYLYIADTLNHRVLMIDLITGDIAHVAGRGDASYSGDNGPARNATLNQPTGLDVDANGNLYITDRGNHALRVVETSGIITTLSGGIGCREQLLFETIPDLCYPSDVNVVSADEYFIADAFNQRIRYIDKKTLSSVFKNQRPNTPTNFMPFPRAIAYDDGLLYFIEGHTGRLQKLDKAGTLTTLAEGFIEPTDISLDNKGNIYISDETGFPITRVDKTSGEIKILAHEKLFARSENSPETQTTTAITISSNNRVFFSNGIDNSIAVIIPRDDELEMIKRNEKNSPRHIQYPLTHLDDTNRYNYFDVDKTEIFSDIAHRLGLHLYIHHVSIGKDGYTLNQERLTARELLILTCFTYNVTCGIEGNTLFVATADIFPSITSAKPLNITNPLSYINNADAMPASLKQEVERDIKIETGVKKIPYEFFSMLDELSLFEFEIDPKYQHTVNARISLEGFYNLGQVLTLFVLLENFRLSYDEISGKIVVGPWQKQE
jgi:serine/threonine protein kinase